jgi:gliding motility-associated-like protein
LLYDWSNGAPGPAISGVPEGQYEVQISDAAGCDTTLSFTLEGPPPLDVDTLIQRPTCNGGTDGAIQLDVSGGNAPYAFQFQNGTFDSLNRWNGLSVGDYPVSVRDSNGCLLQTLIPLRELELQLEPIVDPVRPPSCPGLSDGAVEARIANGQGPYLFDWQDGQGFRPDSRIENLSEGIYSLEVTDANLCRGNFTFSIEDPTPLEVTFGNVPVSCHGGSDGSLIANAAGGTGSYRYNWNGSPGDSILNDVPSGTYDLTLLDANGCRLDTQFALTQPPPLLAEISEITDIFCFGESTGRLVGTGQGGTPPYLYRLDEGDFQSIPEFSNLPAGTYRLTVEDAAGCLDTTLTQLGQAAPFTIEAGTDWQIRLGGSVQLSALPSEPIAGLEWFPSDSLSCVNCGQPIANPTQTTTYQVRAVNSRNCFAQDSVTVFVLDFKPLYFPSAFSPNSDGSNDFFTLFGSDATREILNLSVFDRWGNLVFDRKNLEPGLESQGWDGTWKGKNMPAGTYVFLAEILFVDGKRERFEGEVILLR